MSLLSRLYTFAPGSYVVAVEENAELDNIIGRLHGAVNPGEIEVFSAHSSIAAINARQTGASSLIATFQDASGVTVAQVEKIAAGILPTSDSGLITKGTLAARKVGFIQAFFFGGVPAVDDQSMRFIAPTANFKLVKVSGMCEDKLGGPPNTEGTLVFRCYKQPASGAAASAIGDFSFANGGGAIVAQQTYAQNLTGTPVTMALGDSFYIKVQSQGDNRMRKFTIVLYGYSILES